MTARRSEVARGRLSIVVEMARTMVWRRLVQVVEMGLEEREVETVLRCLDKVRRVAERAVSRDWRGAVMVLM